MTAYGYISPLKHLSLTVPFSPDYFIGHCPFHQLWDGQFFWWRLGYGVS